MSEELVRVTEKELHDLMQKKFEQAGLMPAHADKVADVLVYADARGIHSHGAVRAEYYSERISKGGTTIHPEFKYEQTGPSAGVFYGDNAAGHVVADEAMTEAIKLAKESGIGVVGVQKMGHSGAIAYFVERAAKEDLIAISVTLSDPMVVPFGGSEPYYGTNPIAFSAPTTGDPIIFDMATTVQAWGKVLDARSKNKEIPDTWAVNSNGNPTTDPHAVRGLLPISGPKGYGLMMIVDILSGSLLGLPFGKHVTSMYHDLSEGRDLGQMHIVINPSYFTDLATFKERLTQMISELHSVKPAEGFEQVLYPGELAKITYGKYQEEGIPIVKDIYDYLQSDAIHFDRYDHSDAFADDDKA